MCLTIDQIEQACGFLMLNEFSVFFYCCKKCQCEFDSGINLEAHIILEHQEDKKHFESIFVNEGPVYENFATQSTENRIDIRNENANKAIESPKNHEPIPKTNCAKSSGNEFQAKKRESNINAAVVNKDQTVQIAQQVNRVKRKRKPMELLYCDMCPANVVNFKCKENLKQHMKRHVANKVRKTCTICKKVPINYDKHMQMNHTISPYKCDYCGAAFKNNCNRVIHMRTHTGERPFLCPTCGKSFKSQDTRHKHNMRMHIKKLPHQCLECNRTFICPSQLQEHKFAFHSNARPYVCETCGNSYSTKKYLRKHRQSHGEKTNPCKYCEKKFKTSETRRWHERTVHKAV